MAKEKTPGEKPAENTPEVVETSKNLLRYRNANGMKVEVRVGEVTKPIGPQEIVEFPEELYSDVKPQLIGAWFKV